MTLPRLVLWAALHHFLDTSRKSGIGCAEKWKRFIGNHYQWLGALTCNEERKAETVTEGGEHLLQNTGWTLGGTQRGKSKQKKKDTTTTKNMIFRWLASSSSMCHVTIKDARSHLGHGERSNGGTNEDVQDGHIRHILGISKFHSSVRC
jgi:hypothetical protein